MTRLDDYLEDLNETKKTSYVKVTRQTKIDRALGQLATKLAKETGDPWYKKMVKFRKKYFDMRDKIKTKYAPRVRSRAVSGKGIGDIIAKIKKQKGK
ncbi:MAG: hypothetical protein K9L62_10875 [Vallitaleaceae bacterium]|nr:hypothetical protein [Vallitaleaceae bacterium]